MPGVAPVTVMIVVPVTAHVVAGVHIVALVHVSIWSEVVVRKVILAAVMALLCLGKQVMFLVALALIRWTVTFPTGIMVANAHRLRASVNLAVLFLGVV